MTEKFDVIVVGGGPAGYVCSIRCAQLGLKTMCVEKRETLGGTCLNVGCIPSKTLLHSSEYYAEIQNHSAELGVNVSSVKLDFKKMMERKQATITALATGIKGLFAKNKVTRVQGDAVLKSATAVKVKDEKGKAKLFKAKNIILATGSEPSALPFLDFDEAFILSSTGALAFKEVPKSMIVVGAGVIGVELGSVYSRLGTEVTFVEFLDCICSTLDHTIGKAFQKILEKQGMKFHLNTEVTRGKVNKGQVSLMVADRKQKASTLMTAEKVLVSVGRRPYTEGLGLKKLGIVMDKGGFVAVNDHFMTTVPGIYAIGDLIDGPMLAHKASEEGVALAESIAGHKPSINYMAIPNVIYTNPEVADVGMTEKEAKAEGFEVKTGAFSFKANSRARCTGADEGMVKVIGDAKTRRLLGLHILSTHASEMIHAGVVALEKEVTVDEMGAFCAAHPTLSEAMKEASLAVFDKPIHC